MENKTITLSNGVEMPMLGFGTYKIPDGLEVIDSVTNAINVGYRLIDTAWFYNNEKGVGRAIKNSGMLRSDIFLTTKLWNSHHGYDITLHAFDQSLKNLDTDYIDLYLIHWPGKDKFVDTWRAFIRLYEEGRVNAIGVCNFLDTHIQTLFDQTGMMPMLNQIELHPWLWRQNTIEYCQAFNIALQAWSPLMRAGKMLEVETIVNIAKSHNKTPAQIILRWELQQGISVIPKTTHIARMKENINVFDFQLTTSEMQEIKTLNESRGIGSDPYTMMLDFE